MEMELLKKRKEKAENLPFKELEKHFEAYMDICEKLEQDNTKAEECNLASIIILYYLEKYTKKIVSPQIEEFIFKAVSEKNYKKILILDGYLARKYIKNC